LFEGRTAGAAFADTIQLAKAADRLGLRSYWVQEHHNAASFASVAPEVLIAALGAHTTQIKIGSGGVMLPNYSPLKVAEQFQALSALYPGRIELGIGRATGADPRASAALLGPGGQQFPTMLQLLLDWLLDASGEQRITPDHRAAGIKANPPGPRPDVWMLCSSPASAAFAGAMGLKLAFADFLAPGGAKAALDAYHEAFKPSLITDTPYCAIGLVALAADTEDEAMRLSASSVAWNLARAQGRFTQFQLAETAADLLKDVPSEMVTGVRERSIAGTGEQVASQLKAAAQTAGADELFILTIADTIDARIRSYELLAGEFGLV